MQDLVNKIKMHALKTRLMVCLPCPKGNRSGSHRISQLFFALGFGFGFGRMPSHFMSGIGLIRDRGPTCSDCCHLLVTWPAICLIVRVPAAGTWPSGCPRVSSIKK